MASVTSTGSMLQTGKMFRNSSANSGRSAAYSPKWTCNSYISFGAVAPWVAATVRWESPLDLLATLTDLRRLPVVLTVPLCGPTLLASHPSPGWGSLGPPQAPPGDCADARGCKVAYVADLCRGDKAVGVAQLAAVASRVSTAHRTRRHALVPP
jgi:hypothetical protein